MNWWQKLFQRTFTDTVQSDNPEFGRNFHFANFLDLSPKFNNYFSNKEKIEAIFKSPALLKVICLQCDLFSLGKIAVIQNGKPIDNDPILKLLKNPNPLQSQSQFLWDFMFWNMMGNSFLYIDSNLVENTKNKMYFLDETKMVFPQTLEKIKDKLIFSDSALKAIGDMQVIYKYNDGETINLPLSKISITTDLTNGVGNWFKGNSRLDALYKIISNSEEALNSTNINLRYSGKFIVAGKQDPNDVSKIPMGEEEKKSIEEKMNGNKQIHAVKSMIDIKRFVENMRYLELGKNYLESYYLIGSIFNIPKDVLEANVTGATYENQEKATAKHVSYTLQPKGNNFLESLAKRFGYTEQGKTLEISWSHLPFMNVFELDNATMKGVQATTMTALLALGVDLKEINTYLGTDFKKATYVQPTVNTPADQNNVGQQN